MKYFIFRNHTIENLFGDSECSFSGYDDISLISDNADSYIWFYQLPVKYNEEILSKEVDSYVDKLKLVYNIIPPHKQIIVISLERLYSINYISSDFRVKEAVERFNSYARELSTQCSNVKYVDFSEFTLAYPITELMNWKYYFISQMVVSPKYLSAFRQWFAKIEERIALKRKKCLVLDLDNTLWKGVLGEDGPDGIQVGEDYPGKAFLYFQESLIELSENGVILTVCSKNNEADVFEVWEKNPFVKLNQKYISAYRINWQNKADNIKELASELNIGLDSFVFVDDNPTERELVKQLLPMVEVPDFPEQPYMLPLFFESLLNNYFRIYSITNEDKKKNEQYKANINRTEEQQRFSDFSSYLASLELKLELEKANEFNISRIAQMTQKTNQFNLTTKRYTDSDIRNFLSVGWLVYCVKVKDKFGDNGITGAIILDVQENGTAKIDSFLLSCRVLGKGIETAFFCSVLNILYESGVRQVEAMYIPTAKNLQVANFYEGIGFKLLEEKEGEKLYQKELATPITAESYYNIIIS